MGKPILWEFIPTIEDGAALATGNGSEPGGVADVEAGWPSLLTAQERAELMEHEARVSATDFVQRWTAYGESRTDAPRRFHEANALGLVATAIDRNRWLALQQKSIFSSFYILLLAGSGQRKSTPIDYAESALQSTMPDRVLSNDYSPEALVADLARRTPSRGTALIDEAGRIFSTMRRDRYGEALKDLLSRVWDAPTAYSRVLRSGTFKWTDVYVNLVAATTPARLAETVSPEDILSGFLARFLPVLVTEASLRKPWTALTADTEETARELNQRLLEFRRSLARAPDAMLATERALARFDQASRDLEEWAQRQYQVDLIRPWATRLGEYVARLAIVFAVSEGAVQIKRNQMLRAVAVVDRAKNDVVQLVEELLKDRDARDLDKVARFVRVNPGITKRELQRRTSLSSGRLDSLTRELVAQERIAITSSGGRTVQYYALRLSRES